MLLSLKTLFMDFQDPFHDSAREKNREIKGKQHAERVNGSALRINNGEWRPPERAWQSGIWETSPQSWTGETFIAPASSNPVLGLGLKVTPPWQTTVGEEILCVA